jgi:predicted enzyme related to lactoylglutathione lyase
MRLKGYGALQSAVQGDDRRSVDTVIAEQVMDLLVNIDVDDLPKAIAFYEQAAGLRLGRRFGSLGVEMVGASSAIYLLLKAAGSKPSGHADDLRRYRRHWTPVHLDFVVGDVEAAASQAVAAGAISEGEIQTHPWGRIAQLADPFGHGICFIEFLGRGYDEIAESC